MAYTTYRKKKITRLDDFFVTHIYRKKKTYTTYNIHL